MVERFQGKTRIRTQLGARGQEFRQQAQQLEQSAQSGLSLMKSFYGAASEASIKKGKEAGRNSVILSEDGMLTRMAAPEGLGNKGMAAWAQQSRQAYDAAMQTALANKARALEAQIKLNPNIGADLIESQFRPYAERLVANAGKDLEGHARLTAEAHRQGLVNIAQQYVLNKDFEENKSEIIAHQERLRDNLLRLDEGGVIEGVTGIPEEDEGLRDLLENELRHSLEVSKENGTLSGKEYETAIHQIEKNNVAGPLTGEVKAALADGDIMGAWDRIVDFQTKSFSGVTSAEQMAMANVATRLIGQAIQRDNRERQERNIRDADAEAKIWQDVLPDLTLVSEGEIRRRYENAGLKMTLERTNRMYRLTGMIEKDQEDNIKAMSLSTYNEYGLELDQGKTIDLKDARTRLTDEHYYKLASRQTKDILASAKAKQKSDPERLQRIMWAVRSGRIPPHALNQLINKPGSDIFYFNNRSAFAQLLKDMEKGDVLENAGKLVARGISIENMTPTNKKAVFAQAGKEWGIKDPNNLKDEKTVNFWIGAMKYYGEGPEEIKTLAKNIANGTVTDLDLLPAVVAIVDGVKEPNMAQWQAIQRPDGSTAVGPANFTGMEILGLSQKEQDQLAAIKEAYSQGKDEEEKKANVRKVLTTLKSRTPSSIDIRNDIETAIDNVDDISIAAAANKLAKNATAWNRLKDSMMGRKAIEGDASVGAASQNWVSDPEVEKVLPGMRSLIQSTIRTESLLRGEAIDVDEAMRVLKRKNKNIGITRFGGVAGYAATDFSVERFLQTKYGIEDTDDFLISLLRRNADQIKSQSKQIGKYGMYPERDWSDLPAWRMLLAPAAAQELLPRGGSLETELRPFSMDDPLSTLPKAILKDMKDAFNEGRVRIRQVSDYNGNRISISLQPDVLGENDPWHPVLEIDITPDEAISYAMEKAKVEAQRTHAMYFEDGKPTLAFYAMSALGAYEQAIKGNSPYLTEKFNNAVEEITGIDQFTPKIKSPEGYPYKITNEMPKGFRGGKEAWDDIKSTASAVSGAMSRRASANLKDIKETGAAAAEAIGEGLLPDMDRFPYKVTNKPPKGIR